MSGYYAFWKERNESPKVFVEYFGNSLISWSGQHFGWDEKYLYPVAQFKLNEAERMVRLNPDKFRLAEVYIPPSISERIERKTVSVVHHVEDEPVVKKQRGRRKVR